MPISTRRQPFSPVADASSAATPDDEEEGHPGTERSGEHGGPDPRWHWAIHRLGRRSGTARSREAECDGVDVAGLGGVADVRGQSPRALSLGENRVDGPFQEREPAGALLVCGPYLDASRCRALVGGLHRDSSHAMGTGPLDRCDLPQEDGVGAGRLLNRR